VDKTALSHLESCKFGDMGSKCSKVPQTAAERFSAKTAKKPQSSAIFREVPQLQQVQHGAEKKRENQKVHNCKNSISLFCPHIQSEVGTLRWPINTLLVFPFFPPRRAALAAVAALAKKKPQSSAVFRPFLASGSAANCRKVQQISGHFDDFEVNLGQKAVSFLTPETKTPHFGPFHPAHQGRLGSGPVLAAAAVRLGNTPTQQNGDLSNPLAAGRLIKWN